MPQNRIFAQFYEDGVIEVSTDESSLVMESSTISGKVNYELPYPGMLPDNPFYFLKMARDRIIKTLISDPFKKAQFNLLTGQKRMYAGKLLVEKKKHDLALETIEKSNNYLVEAIKDIEEAKKANPKNIEIDPFLHNFETVTLKHTEILKEIKPKVGKENVEKVEWQEKRLQEIQINVYRLLNRKNPNK